MAFSSSSYTMSEILAKGFFSWAAAMLWGVNWRPSGRLESWDIGHLASERVMMFYHSGRRREKQVKKRPAGPA